MKSLLITLALATLTSAASAQVVYSPVRYQYGQYNEVYYGGRNPAFTQNSYVYLPPALQSAYNAQRLNAAPYLTAYASGPTGNFYSPFTPDARMTNPAFTPFIYSDFLPYEEVGQYGYSINQSRNEAYANVPRLQSALRPQSPQTPAEPATPAADQRSKSPADLKLKAIPLLNWARSEGTKNPQLTKALFAEAFKYDPAATSAAEHALTSDR